MSVVEMPAIASAPVVGAPPVAAGATWAPVGPHLWVASRRGEFLGTVERVDGEYLACDGQATELGRFADLDSAKFQVLYPASPEVDRSSDDREMSLAWLTAIIGATAIVGSLFMLLTGVAL